MIGIGVWPDKHIYLNPPPPHSVLLPSRFWGFALATLQTRTPWPFPMGWLWPALRSTTPDLDRWRIRFSHLPASCCHFRWTTQRAASSAPSASSLEVLLRKYNLRTGATWTNYRAFLKFGEKTWVCGKWWSFEMLKSFCLSEQTVRTWRSRLRWRCCRSRCWRRWRFTPANGDPACPSCFPRHSWRSLTCAASVPKVRKHSRSFSIKFFICHLLFQ